MAVITPVTGSKAFIFQQFHRAMRESNIHPSKFPRGYRQFLTEIQAVSEFYVKHWQEINEGVCFMKNRELPRTIIGGHVVFDEKEDPVICEGAFKTGFHAVYPYCPSDKRIVLKTKTPLDTPDKQRAAKMEKIVLNQLQGVDGIAHAHCITEQEGFQYIILDFYNNSDLITLLESNVSLSESDEDYIALRIVSTLSDIHRAGIILRDVKLENILMKEKNGVHIADFTDFGFSCLNPRRPIKTLSQELFQGVGTPHYYPPENCRNLGTDDFLIPATPGWDVWSTGITLFALYKKELPKDIGTFKDRENLEPLCQYIGAVKGPFFNPNEPLGGTFGNQIAHMLDGNPEQRYTSERLAEEMFDLFLLKHPQHLFSQYAGVLRDFFPKRVVRIIFSHL